ncbi:MAG: cytidylate kinase-like family protein [Oscillospiraceae bacterium]|jgi:cytidylate kinase|nr:cytidylate kinase-like family protein [Oscillospiraceae bacterium]
MSKYVITISREYGSGGRPIGNKLGEALGVGCYDKSIIAMAAEKSGLSPGYIERSEENVPSNFLLNFKYSTSAFSGAGLDSISYYDTPTNDKMFLSQSAAIREIAARESCIIIGRCADYVLRDEPGLVRVFIRAEKEDRLQRAIEDYDLPRKNAEAQLKRIDKSRANYYRYYTNRAWGGIEHTDLVINSSFTGTDGAVDIIKTMLQAKGLL